MKKILSFFLIVSMILTFLVACDDTTDTTRGNPQATPTAAPTPTPAGNTSTNQEEDAIIIKCDSWMATITKFDQKAEDDEIDTGITLADSNTVIEGNGATYKDGKVLIGAAGTYLVTGTLNGSIIIDVPATDKVHLILKGVTITSTDYAAIAVIAGDKVGITLADGTTNTLTDVANYTYSYSATVIPNACLFSKEDLTINGSGTLIVKSNYNNGITSKDDLKILDGNLDVTAVNHGIRGNDSVLINGGSIKIYAGNDGIKSSNTLESAKGFVFVTGGSVNVKATDDGIQAISAVYITEGKADVACGGKSINCKGAVFTKDNSFSEYDY